MSVYTNAGFGDSIPIGSIVDWPSDTVPTNWMICNGAEISRTNYNQLFNIIGTTYGVGDNSTTFNLPNIIGKVTVGKDDSDDNFKTLGLTGGEKTHTLSISEMPSHTHTQQAHNHTQNAHTHTQNAHGHGITDPGHNHAYTRTDYSYANNFDRTYVNQGLGSATQVAATTTSVGTGISINSTTATNQNTTATNNATTAINDNTGGGLAHNNLQPFMVFNKIIKVR